MDPYELIQRFTDWVQSDERVIAAGICGSYARGESRPDSDIDFCIITTDPNRLLDDISWVYRFGASARVVGAVEDYNLVQAIRVFYGPTEAEFGVTDPEWARSPIDKETAGVINNGLQILYDPEGRLASAVAEAKRLR